MKSYFSSGGLGDTWIQMLKILEDNPERDGVIWRHINSHECHVQPIQELMESLPCLLNAESILVPKTEVKTHEIEDKVLKSWPGMKRLNSKVKELRDPFCPEDVKKEWIGDPPYTFSYQILQPLAGRMGDASKRGFGKHIIKSVARNSNLKTVLLGAAHGLDLEDIDVIDLCDKTDIEDALIKIDKAEYVMAQDGFIAYVAMSCQVPALVNWHIPTLPDHYMHPKWERLTQHSFGGNFI